MQIMYIFLGATTRSSKKKANPYYVHQKVREAEALGGYLKEINSGLSTMIGSSKLHDLATEMCAEAGKLRRPNVVSDLDKQKEMLIDATIENIQVEIEVTVHVYLQRHHDIGNLAGRYISYIDIIILGCVGH